MTKIIAIYAALASTASLMILAFRTEPRPKNKGHTDSDAVPFRHKRLACPEPEGEIIDMAPLMMLGSLTDGQSLDETLELKKYRDEL